MRSSFLSNYSDVKFIDKLKKNIDTCKAFFFSVSFIKKPGLRLIAPNIEAALARGAYGQLITSTYQNFTDIDSLQYFYLYDNYGSGNHTFLSFLSASDYDTFRCCGLLISFVVRLLKGVCSRYTI